MISVPWSILIAPTMEWFAAAVLFFRNYQKLNEINANFQFLKVQSTRICVFPLAFLHRKFCRIYEKNLHPFCFPPDSSTDFSMRFFHAPLWHFLMTIVFANLTIALCKGKNLIGGHSFFGHKTAAIAKTGVSHFFDIYNGFRKLKMESLRTLLSTTLLLLLVMVSYIL